MEANLINIVSQENQQILQFIKDFQFKNEYNPKFLDEYNKKFNAEFDHYLKNNNFHPETLKTYIS